MKLKNMNEAELDDLIGVLDNEGFWYALSDGGYLNPEDVLEDEKDIKRVQEAIQTLIEFEASLPEV